MKIIWITLLTWWLMWATTHPIGAADTNKLANTPELGEIRRILIEQPDHTSSWGKWFEYHLTKNGRENSYRRFGPLSSFSWTKAYFNREEHGPERAESQGEDFFGDTTSDAAIDAFNSWFNFSRFKQAENPGLTFGAKLAEGTLNTVEGRMRPTQIEPEDTASLQEWVGSFVVEDSTKYGFNVLNSNPYGYYSVAFLRKKNGLPLVISTTRIRVMFTRLNFDQPRLEEELLFPVTPATQFSVGGKAYPTAFNKLGWKPSVTLKFTHQLEHNVVNGNVLYASAQIGEKESFYLIGVTLDRLIWKK